MNAWAIRYHALGGYPAAVRLYTLTKFQQHWQKAIDATAGTRLQREQTGIACAR
jgi:hypothetical protein